MEPFDSKEETFHLYRGKVGGLMGAEAGAFQGNSTTPFVESQGSRELARNLSDYLILSPRPTQGGVPKAVPARGHASDPSSLPSPPWEPRVGYPHFHNLVPCRAELGLDVRLCHLSWTTFVSF